VTSPLGVASKAPAECGPGRLLSAQDAASYMGVPYTSLRDWALRGHVPIVRVPDCRRLWFDRRDLERCIEAWKERGSRPVIPNHGRVETPRQTGAQSRHCP
jgi:hypothetical protein